MSELYQPPEEVVAFLESHDRFLVFGHVEPDGDCVASQLALDSFLKRRGKQVSVFSEGPFDRPEIKPYENGFRTRIEASDLEGSPVAVILDCSTPDRIGAMGRGIEGLPVLVIDHHASGEVFGNVRWVIPQAPSVTFLIQRLIEEYPDKPTAEEAQLLLFGLARDTGFFRHLVENSGFVFQAVARLVDGGASPRNTYRMIHSGWEVVAFIQEEEQGRCSVGLRSNGRWDVGTLARSLGGGGHTLAAGYSGQGSIAGTRERLLQALIPLLGE